MMFIDNELIIFIDEALSKTVELLSRLVSPPIDQVSMLVILAACKAQQLFIPLFILGLPVTCHSHSKSGSYN